MQVKVSGQYTKELANKEDLYGSVDATARIENLDIDKVKHYIPLQTPKTLKEWLSGGLKGGKVSEGVIPVSYTHLDVYKRQVSGRTYFECGSCSFDRS